jgi:hypothetical protein
MPDDRVKKAGDMVIEIEGRQVIAGPAESEAALIQELHDAAIAVISNNCVIFEGKWYALVPAG